MPHFALRLLTIAAIGALVALILYAGEPKELWWWFLATPFSAWIIGPTIVPYLVARSVDDRHWFVWAALAFFTLSTAWAAHVYYQAFFMSKSSTAALVMISAPFYQWAALGAFGLVCGCVSVWLRQRSNR